MKAHEEKTGVGKHSAPPQTTVPRRKAAKARHRQQRSDDANAFIPDPEGGPARIDDDLAENLAEGFVLGATQDEDADDISLDGMVPEEIGGPFVETSGAEEFAEGTDGANPRDAKREPLPRPVAGLSHAPEVDLEEEEDDE
jgi:hypothetical protein